MINGIDISHNNDINLAIIDSSIKFVWNKATQGATFKDPAFNDRWHYLRDKTQLFRGAYHFLTVDDSAESQANNFLSCGIDFSKPNVLPPVIDVEDMVPASFNAHILANKEAFIQKVTDWINIVQAATKRTVIIYSYKNFFAEYLNNMSWPNNPLWIASYQQHAPGLPQGWTEATFWQYSQYGTPQDKPTGGSLDLDYFNGTVEQLSLL